MTTKNVTCHWQQGDVGNMGPDGEPRGHILDRVFRVGLLLRQLVAPLPAVDGSKSHRAPGEGEGGNEGVCPRK